MSWTDSPHIGEAYVRGREKRTVYDRSLGGDVLYYTGTERRRRHRVTEAQWFEWVQKARCAECDGAVGLVYTHYQFCSYAEQAAERP